MVESRRSMPRASLNLHWHAWSRFEIRHPSIQPSLQSLRIFRSRPRVSSINFKAALDATCNTFSGALTDAWPLFPPWSARATDPFNKPLPFDVSTNKKPGWKSSWTVSRARSQLISSFLSLFSFIFFPFDLSLSFSFFFPFFAIFCEWSARAHLRFDEKKEILVNEERWTTLVSSIRGVNRANYGRRWDVIGSVVASNCTLNHPVSRLELGSISSWNFIFSNNFERRV